MKNTFKYIVALVAFSAATLASGLSVFGQNLNAGTYVENNGIAYAKRATINSDGTYTIDLESFVTGEVHQTYEGVPCDIVLVLDVSGSMDEAISTISGYEVADVSSITASQGSFGMFSDSWQTDYFYLYNGSYYRVSVGRGGNYWNRRYYLYFTVRGTTYYINTSGQVVRQEPTNVNSDNTNLLASNVQLYQYVTTTTTKMDALKSAVGSFIDQINHNCWYEDETDEKPRKDEQGNPDPIDNRISIVKFACDQYYNSNAGNTSDSAPLTAGDHDFLYQKEGYYDVPNANYTEVVSGFTSVKNETQATILKNTVLGLHAAGPTAADYGMNLARLLINSVGSDPTRDNSNRTVVFFTDGAPTYGSRFDASVASAAVQNSNSIKDVTYGEGEDATHPAVFSVGVFKSGDATTQVTNFMTNIATDSSHYMDASGGTAEDLKDIFTSIAHSAGGSGNTQVSGTSSVTVDIVSSSFSVPKGFEENPGGAISVLVAPCTGITNIDGKDYLTFGQAKTPAQYGLDDIEPSISEKDNKVSTTGFDYSANWCGPDPTSLTGYHGYKQIIRFTITVKDDAVGGPAVETNDSDSGIYLDGSDEPLITFNRPTVKLPVQIWIQKNGLRPGDSAVFTLAMCKFNDWDPKQTDINKQKWSSFTKVVINYSDMDENGVVKIVGLDPDYFYRLKEDAWAFGYTYQDGGVQYTVGDNVANPFIFTNTPKDLKFDEASARNIFNEKTAE